MKTSHIIIWSAVAVVAAFAITKHMRKPQEGDAKPYNRLVAAAQAIPEKTVAAAGSIYNSLSGVIGQGPVPPAADKQDTPSDTTAPRTVIFKTSLGYLRATPSGIVYSNSQFITSWERFRVTASKEIAGKFDIRSNAGLFLASDPSGSVSAGAGIAGPWTSWTLEHQGGDKYLIVSYHGKYLTVHPDGSTDASSMAPLDWSLFHMVQV